MKKVFEVIGIILLVLCVLAVLFCIGVCITMMVKNLSFVDCCKELWETIKSWFVSKPKTENATKTLLSFLGVM